MLPIPIMAKFVQKDVTIIIFLALIWITLVLIVNPIGDFPSNDDWAYGWTVKTLLTTRQFRLSDWAAPNLLPQAILGTLFTLPFGFSFTALRFSTLTLGLIGVLVTYGLLREINAGVGIAFCAALVITLNPLYFVLANSFMNDVPSFTFFMSSIYCILRGLKFRSCFTLGFGIAMCFLAILNRQSSLIIIPALMSAYLMRNGFKPRYICSAGLIGIAGLAVYVSYPKWLEFAGRIPLMYNTQVVELLDTYSRGIVNILTMYLHNIAIMAVYLGLFLLPFLIIVASVQYRYLSASQKQFWVLPAAFLVVVAAVFLATVKPMPLTGNILNFFNLGGQSLTGYDSILEPASIAFIRRGWQVLTVLGVVGAALLLNCVILLTSQQLGIDQQGMKAARGRSKSWLLIFVIGITLMYVLAVAGLDKGRWFDRYLILFLPLLMMIASMSTPTVRERRIGFWPICSATSLLVPYGVVTIAGTHDHMVSNRVLWQALNNAMETNRLEPSEIDGGFEFNGWYLGNDIATCNPAFNRGDKSTEARVTDFKCLSDNERWQYRISYVPEAGFSIEQEYHFRRWLPWRDQTLYVLRRLP